MGWFVPNNDIGYLICNRRQYRLATPHFIPPSRPSTLAAPDAFSRSGRHPVYTCIHEPVCVYLYRVARQGCRYVASATFTAPPNRSFPILYSWIKKLVAPRREIFIRSIVRSHLKRRFRKNSGLFRRLNRQNSKVRIKTKTT